MGLSLGLDLSLGHNPPAPASPGVPTGDGAADFSNADDSGIIAILMEDI